MPTFCARNFITTFPTSLQESEDAHSRNLVRIFATEAGIQRAISLKESENELDLWWWSIRKTISNNPISKI